MKTCMHEDVCMSGGMVRKEFFKTRSFEIAFRAAVVDTWPAECRIQILTVSYSYIDIC